MYSKKVQELLDKKGIKIGDRVSLSKDGKLIEGLLIPQTGTGDPYIIVLKLDNGYNAGFSFENAEIKKCLIHPQPKKVREEEEYELGKVKKSLLKVEFDKKKPPISLISTGGTIASRVDYATGGVKALEDPREFLHNVPELAGIVNIKRLVSTEPVMSEDIAWDNWIEIARHVAGELNSGSHGVIVSHGTDTLHYTSAALSFFLHNLHKPVILVGAQRSSDRGSSDAGMNLVCSAYAAISDIGEVGTCMHGSVNDDYCLFIRGTRSRKMHTSRRDAFRPINEMPLARIFPNGRIETINKDFRKRQDKEVKVDAKYEPKVALIKAYPGSDPAVMDFFAGKGYKGFVVEGTGLGHVPTLVEKSWIGPIKKAVRDGIPVVVTSQTIYGRINPDVYANLRTLYHRAKAIPGEDMTSETAYIKLGWVLGHTQDMEEVRKQILTNYAGEIAERTLPQSFLY